jgi:hypothetical protein
MAAFPSGPYAYVQTEPSPRRLPLTTGSEAVVDPAEREGLHRHVGAVPGHRQHLALGGDRTRGVDVVAELGALRPQHPDQLPVAGGQFDDPGSGAVSGGVAV